MMGQWATFGGRPWHPFQSMPKPTATPKKRTGPTSRALKVLAGMRGTLWIDRETFHTIRGDCTVLSSVPVYGMLARVLPGTHIDLDLERGGIVGDAQDRALCPHLAADQPRAVFAVLAVQLHINVIHRIAGALHRVHAGNGAKPRHALGLFVDVSRCAAFASA